MKHSAADMNAAAVACVPVTIKPANRPPVQGKLKRLGKMALVVTCDTQLPRNSDCEVTFKLPDQDRPMVVPCKVEENVHAAMGVDVYLKINRSPKTHISGPVEKLASN